MNIMKMATGALSPILVNKLASTLGLSPGIAKQIVSVGVPMILAAVMKRGASQDGAEAIRAGAGPGL